MNLEFLSTFGQLIFALGITLGLIFICFKFMSTKLDVINNNKYVKVIERIQVSKENFIIIIKIGKKGYVISSSSGHMEKLSELSEEEINNIEEDKQRVANEMTDKYNKLILKLQKGFSNIVKNLRSKEEKHEK